MGHARHARASRRQIENAAGLLPGGALGIHGSHDDDVERRIDDLPETRLRSPQRLFRAEALHRFTDEIGDRLEESDFVVAELPLR